MNNKIEGLDAVILLVCLLGPAIIAIFSMLANLIGDENRTGVPSWIMNIFTPFTDILGCILQVTFNLKSDFQ